MFFLIFFNLKVTTKFLQNPQDFWNFGLNLVALNYQTPGLMMDLQEGKFAANGACGYVLKPAIMFDEVFTPTEKMPFAPQVYNILFVFKLLLVTTFFNKNLKKYFFNYLI